MLPSIFGESLFDDWFDFPFRGFESDVDHKLYGKHAARVMKTDLKDHDDHYSWKWTCLDLRKIRSTCSCRTAT